MGENSPYPEGHAAPDTTLPVDIGRRLAEAREDRGETIDAPAHTLRLSREKLLALESGDWSSLPGEVYIFAFLRQYSNYLQVDIYQEIELLKSQGDLYKLTKPLTFPDPPIAPAEKWAWMTATAFIFLFILFNALK